MIPKLNSRELKHLGVRGGDDSFIRKGDLVLLPLDFALNDNGDEVDTAYPGDVLVLQTRASVSPDQTVGLAELNADLLAHGHCSFPRLITEEHAGPIQVLFRCEREINLNELPYLAMLVSLGTAKQ